MTSILNYSVISFIYYLSIYVPIYLSIYLSYIYYLSIYVPIYLSTNLSLYKYFNFFFSLAFFEHLLFLDKIEIDLSEYELAAIEIPDKKVTEVKEVKAVMLDVEKQKEQRYQNAKPFQSQISPKKLVFTVEIYW